jgi:disulfide oxidoreductase YuzD
MTSIASLLVEADPLVEASTLPDMVQWLAAEAHDVYPGHGVSVTYIDDLGVDA